MDFFRNSHACPSTHIDTLGRLNLDRSLLLTFQWKQLQLAEPQLFLGELPIGPRGLNISTDLTVFPLPNRRHASPEIDHAISHKDICRRLLIDRREHTKVRHHEDAVDRYPRTAHRLVGIDHHQHGLNPTRGMGQDPAASDDQIQLQHIDQ